MKIGMTTFGGDGGKSGISQYIIKLLEQFGDMNELGELEVFLYEDEQEIFAKEESNFESLLFGNQVRSPVANIAWHQLSLPRWVRRRAYDVMFLPAGNRRLPATCPCPTVGTVHDFSSLHVAGKYDWSRLFYIKQVLPRLVRQLTRVLTVSECSKRDIVQYAGVPEEKVIVTPLAVDHQTYFVRDREECAERMKEKYNVDRPYLLYVSRIEHPGKNHAKLIEAFNLIKAKEDIPHQLVLAGSDWNGAEEVHRMAEASPFSDDIVFTGFAPTEDLPDMYGAADLFVFPSLYEGFGLPILEAMASGAPTACSNVSSLPEVAGDAAALFDPRDAESIAESVAPILLSQDKRTELSDMGVSRASKFTWRATARKTMEVLHQAAL